MVLDCHREPERYLRPPEQVFSMTWTPADEGKDQLTLGRELMKEHGIQPPDKLFGLPPLRRGT